MAWALHPTESLRVVARMRPFWYDGMPGRAIFGVGSLPRVAHQAAELGCERVLVITGGAARIVAGAVIDMLGERVVAAFAEIAQHVPERLADAAIRCAKQTGADVLVAVGGGSATGLAKAVAVDTGLPIIAVPTTYAGSEMTPLYGITGEHKITKVDLRALPRVVVYDPAVTVGLPPRVTATSGLNAIAHCVEALHSSRVDPVSALLAVEGIRVLAQALPMAVQSPGDLDARAAAMYGAHLAGRSLNAGTGLHHKLCHVIGGDFGLVHAEVHAALLPYSVAFNKSLAPDAMAVVGTAIGASDAAAGLRELSSNLGAPASLAEVGVPAEVLDAVADRAARETGHDAAAVRTLLHSAYHGVPPDPIP